MTSLLCELFTNASQVKKNLLPGKFIRLLPTITDQAQADYEIGFLPRNQQDTKLYTLPLWGQKVVGLKCRYEAIEWTKLQKRVMQLITNTNKETQAKTAWTYG